MSCIPIIPVAKRHDVNYFETNSNKRWLQLKTPTITHALRKENEDDRCYSEAAPSVLPPKVLNRLLSRTPPEDATSQPSFSEFESRIVNVQWKNAVAKLCLSLVSSLHGLELTRECFILAALHRTEASAHICTRVRTFYTRDSHFQETNPLNPLTRK